MHDRRTDACSRALTIRGPNGPDGRPALHSVKIAWYDNLQPSGGYVSIDGAKKGTVAMLADTAVERARELFLDGRNLYGCAETAFVVLKEAFGLPDAAESSAAMALNGGIAYSGGACGAVTGAALAVGMLAARRIPNHRAAKRAARLVTADLLAAFEAEFGTLACRELIEVDLRTAAGHRAFIRSGVWRDRCMRQVELVVARLASLGDETTWDATIKALESAEGTAGSA